MSRMFYSHFKSIPKKSIRPLANELQKSIAKKLKDIRPSAYESQKSIPKKARPLAYESQKSVSKKARRPLAYASHKCAETNKRPPASSSATQKRAETKKRSLALDSEKRAGSEAVGSGSPLISVQEDDLVGSVHESDAAHWKRHRGDPSSSTCGRCLYIRNKADFMREHSW